jgi:uncharacterized membrane protein YfcA
VETLIIFIGALCAGFIGSLTGLGGAIIIIPLLNLGLGYDMKYAIGTGLIAVVATSSGASLSYSKSGISNVKIGLFLVVASTLGAMIGALVGQNIPVAWLYILFGAILIFTAYMQFRKKGDNFLPAQTTGLANSLQLQGIYNDAETNTVKHYEAGKPVTGFLLMILAGMLSGLLGIGAGVMKVLAMDTKMKLPFKVSTSTSVFMIGMTAFTSLVMYAKEGYIVAAISAPVALGVLLGATMGAKVLTRVNTKLLKQVFVFIVLIIALQMIYKGINQIIQH